MVIRLLLNKCKVEGLTLETSRIARSDERLTLETSAFESLYGGQFTLSTQLIKTYLSSLFNILPKEAAPQFLQKLTPIFICCLMQASNNRNDHKSQV